MFALPQLIQTEVFTEVPPALRKTSIIAERMTTNIAYGGPDRKTIYITDSSTGTILMARVPTAGRVLYSHM